jgi:AraC-like DNA-binding protein
MMPGIPIPFVISLLLIVLLGRLISQNEPTLRPAIVFVGACAMLTIVAGLRWSFDIRAIRFLQPIIASSLPPIAWFCFTGLKGSEKTARLWVHALPVGLVLILSALWPPPIDPVLAVMFFGYGAGLLSIGAGGPDELAATRLADAPRAHRATVLAGLFLASSGAVDLLIAGDFDFYQGAHAASIVGIANMVMLPLIAYAVAVAGKSISAPAALDPPDSSGDQATASMQSERPGVSTASDALIVETIDTLMHQKQLFRDPDLTLNRLARKSGIPSRQISTAINRVFGRNVSQVVNEYRIKEAKRLLALSDMPVTGIIFESGFQTKSNFNREFLRVAGMNPSDYRRSNAQSPEADKPIFVELPSRETR